MKRVYLLCALVLALAACRTAEPETDAGESTVDKMEGVMVTNVRANMTLPSDTGSIWMEIHNHTENDDALVGAAFEGCKAIELHDMTMENDVMVMREVEGGKIPVPAGEKVELKRGGLHVMCIGKEAPLEVGSTLDIALQFANAGTINVMAMVVEPGEMNMDMDGGEHSGIDVEEGDHSEMEMDADQ